MLWLAGGIVMRAVLEKALQAGYLKEIDLYGALFIADLAENTSAELLLAAALVSQAVRNGHICLPLGTVAGKPAFPPDVPCRAPELATWRQHLLASGVIGPPGHGGPLVLDSRDRLYFARYYNYEHVIAQDLLGRNSGLLPVDPMKFERLFACIFPEAAGDSMQKVAACVAALKRFIVISGGPGTGKTYTVARILALLQALEEGTLRTGLVAPTGKAAVRLKESIEDARQFLDDKLASLVPSETKTLHRLLGFNPGSGAFRYNRQNKLHLDLLVIDEASMIDVPLMASLVEALPEKTRVIMLGDRDQLTSVEAGSLFGDVCSASEPLWSPQLCEKIEQLTRWAPGQSCSGETFYDSIVSLQKSYRFEEKKGIAALALAVNGGNADTVAEMYGRVHDDLVLMDPEDPAAQGRLEEHLLSGFTPCFASRDPAEALKALGRFRILCAVREGETGVEGVNQLAERTLRQHGTIQGNDPWYRGKPLIIRSNHYSLELFNGDTGVVWPDESGKLWAWFSRHDDSLHRVPLTRLPEHDTAYAITVHQSQGSEFADVLFLLPSADSLVLSRELVYTGITRAREKLVLVGQYDLLAKAIERRVVRHSGLGEKLRKTA